MRIVVASLRRLGEDVTEELEYVPGRFIVNRITRPRFACSGCDHFTQAQLPSRPIERGRPGPGLLAKCSGQQICRSSAALPRKAGYSSAADLLDLDRSFAGRLALGKSTALVATGRCHRTTCQAGQALFADDTPVKMLTPGAGKTQTARLWTYVRDERPWDSEAPPAAWYQFSPDRRGQHPKDHLKRYQGWMHADGYSGFNDLYRSGDIREVACMAHIRRKFVDVHKAQGSAIAEEAIKRIAGLYAIEKEARGSPPDQRTAIRQAEARPVFDDLGNWLGGPTARYLWQIATCRGHPLCADPVATAPAIP